MNKKEKLNKIRKKEFFYFKIRKHKKHNFINKIILRIIKMVQKGARGIANSLDFSETGNWNVAARYTDAKIMKPLYLCDEYERVATFGTSELVEEFMIDEQTRKVARIKAIKRLAMELNLLISNTIFAIKKKTDAELMKKFKDDLQRIIKVLPMVEGKSYDQIYKKNVITINEDKFEYFLKLLTDIKEQLNEPLNNADLIFTYVEDFDPDKFKQTQIQRMIDRA